MPIERHVKDMVVEANSRITTLAVDQAINVLGSDSHVFVDIRDIRELKREGIIPGAFHAPRGMLEFWVDPACPYYKPIFGEDKTFVFYCASAWRSALATKAVQDMGLSPVAHLAGGFSAWKAAGLTIASYTET